MSKAEDLAKELYPDWEMTGVSIVDGQEESMVRIQRVAYIKGYHQAKEDLELTWEDIPKILHICEQLKTRWWFIGDDEQTKLIGTQVFWEEVLKQFKDLKQSK